MSKVSSKLAAGVRKVKTQETITDPVQPAEREIEARDEREEKKPKPSPKIRQPERVWPD